VRGRWRWSSSGCVCTLHSLITFLLVAGGWHPRTPPTAPGCCRVYTHAHRHRNDAQDSHRDGALRLQQVGPPPPPRRHQTAVRRMQQTLIRLGVSDFLARARSVLFCAAIVVLTLEGPFGGAAWTTTAPLRRGVHRHPTTRESVLSGRHGHHTSVQSECVA
jgi:hypothetical protein